MTAPEGAPQPSVLTQGNVFPMGEGVTAQDYSISVGAAAYNGQTINYEADAPGGLRSVVCLHGPDLEITGIFRKEHLSPGSATAILGVWAASAATVTPKESE